MSSVIAQKGEVVLQAGGSNKEVHVTEAIGDVYNNPVIAIDKITQAHNDLIEAMDIADRLKQEGIDSARENIAKLGQLSAELQRRASGLVGTTRCRGPIYRSINATEAARLEDVVVVVKELLEAKVDLPFGIRNSGTI